MHEKLDETLASMDKKVAKIANACLDNIQKAIDTEETVGTISNEAHTTKIVGEALKALADGLESYKAVTSSIKTDASLPP
jgi:DNA-binding ferritin-like protein